MRLVGDVWNWVSVTSEKVKLGVEVVSRYAESYCIVDVQVVAVYGSEDSFCKIGWIWS